MAFFYPEIGSWYQEQNSSTLLEVVAVDEKSGSIEVQYEGGEIAEFDMESWGQLELIPAEAPEDANSAYGLSPLADDSDMNHSYGGYSNPLESIEPDIFTGYDDLI